MDNLKYVFLYVAIVVLVWGMGSLFADSISDYEVIAPEDGVNCVVVSRVFNTSVDCWKK